jgi:hypothetical protein
VYRARENARLVTGRLRQPLLGEVEPVLDVARGVVPDGPRVGVDGVQAEAEGDQVEAPVAAGRAVPVHDAGDAAAFGQEVARLEVGVDGVVSVQEARVPGADLAAGTRAVDAQGDAGDVADGAGQPVRVQALDPGPRAARAGAQGTAVKNS